MRMGRFGQGNALTLYISDNKYNLRVSTGNTRIRDFCAEGRGFDPRPGQDRRYFSSPVTFKQGLTNKSNFM